VGVRDTESGRFLDERNTEDRYPATTMSGAEERTGQESYRNREDLISEPAMTSASAGGDPSDGMRGLEAGNQDRRGDEGYRQDGDAGRGSVRCGPLLPVLSGHNLRTLLVTKATA
jgi:hypothetical protein